MARVARTLIVKKQTTTHTQISTENKSKWNPISISNKSLQHTSQGCFHLDMENPSHPATTSQEFIDWSQFVKFTKWNSMSKGHVFITSSFISKANILVICFIFQPSNPPKTSFVHFGEYLSNMSNNTLKLAHILAKATFFWVLRELGSLLVYNIGIWMVLGDEALAHWWQQSWIVKVKLDFGVLKLYGILKTLLNSILALHLDASSVSLCSLSILWPFWFQRFDPLSDLPGWCNNATAIAAKHLIDFQLPTAILYDESAGFRICNH